MRLTLNIKCDLMMRTSRQLRSDSHLQWGNNEIEVMLLNFYSSMLDVNHWGLTFGTMLLNWYKALVTLNVPFECRLPFLHDTKWGSLFSLFCDTDAHHFCSWKYIYIALYLSTNCPLHGHNSCIILTEILARCRLILKKLDKPHYTKNHTKYHRCLFCG